MTTWNERILTCMHGIQEGLDSHSCPQCQTVAKEIGMVKARSYDTFIFTSQKQVDKLRKKTRMRASPFDQSEKTCQKVVMTNKIFLLLASLFVVSAQSNVPALEPAMAQNQPQVATDLRVKSQDITGDKIQSAKIEKRYAVPAHIIHRNTGFAHMTRGMNSCTILALRVTVTDKDIPVLRKMLSDKDNVIRLTVINTLSIMGAAGISALVL